MSKQPSSRSCFVCGVENPTGLHMNFYMEGPGEVVAEYRKYGCTCPILYPVGGDVRLLIDTFAQQ